MFFETYLFRPVLGSPDGGDGANISGGRWEWGGGKCYLLHGGEGGKHFRGVDGGGEGSGVPEFPETGGKHYLLHGGEPPSKKNIMG